MTTLSLAMIVKNEEESLERCLNSVKNIVDEIVIVDTGSTDRTKEIAKKFTSNIYDFEWIDDFSAARNYSFEMCTCDFILWLDADDIIEPEETKKIQELDLSNKEYILADYIYCQDPLLIVPRERIIKRDLNLKWEMPVHEAIPLVGNTFFADFKIHHYRIKSGSSERNMRILEKAYQKNSKDPRIIYYLAKEYQDEGEVKNDSKMIEKAIGLFEKRIEMNNGFIGDTFYSYYRLAKYYYGDNDKKFKDNIYECLRIEERVAEPNYLMGQFYFNSGDWNKAIHWFEICARLKKLDLTYINYRPEYYTWYPAMQLSVCYWNIGNLEKAYEYSKKFLKYRPNDSKAINNEIFLREALNRKRDGGGKRLNLGCGGKREEGYINVDIFPGEGVDEVFSMDKIPYLDGTISAIHSEHALEHLGYRQIEETLKEWYRVLCSGGELLLKIPDIDLCCQKLLEGQNREWYKYTIYGYQKSLAGEGDEFQYHKWGFNKDEIKGLLENIGFVIDYLENYDGYDTPSIGLRAIKPVSNIKIGWISPISWEAAQVRIRVLNIDRLLRSKGYNSKIVNYPEIINQNYDVAIVGKAFDEHHYKNIKMLKQYGKTVFCDLCEDILEYPWVEQILKISDKVICCSHKLEEKVRKININTEVIEDSYET